MKKIFWLVILLSLLGVSHAQNYTTVTATNVIDAVKQKVQKGKLCFTGTDSNDNIISYQPGGGGTPINKEICTNISFGKISTFQVANPNLTSPPNINYRIEVYDSIGKILTYPKTQISGATFDFDSYELSPSFGITINANRSQQDVLAVGTYDQEIIQSFGFHAAKRQVGPIAIAPFISAAVVDDDHPATGVTGANIGTLFTGSVPGIGNVISALELDVQKNGDGSLPGGMFGITLFAENIGAGEVSTIIGISENMDTSSDSIVLGDVIGIEASNMSMFGSVGGNLIGIDVLSPNGSATVAGYTAGIDIKHFAISNSTANYALHILDQGTDYAIRVEGGKVSLADSVIPEGFGYTADKSTGSMAIQGSDSKFQISNTLNLGSINLNTGQTIFDLRKPDNNNGVGILTTIDAVNFSPTGFGLFTGLTVNAALGKTIDSVYGIYVYSTLFTGPGTLTNNYGVQIFNQGGQGDNNYALHIDNQGSGAKDFAIKSEGGRVAFDNPVVPASAGATGTKGEIAWDSGFIYVCTATNTWKRVAISTWP